MKEHGMDEDEYNRVYAAIAEQFGEEAAERFCDENVAAWVRAQNRDFYSDRSRDERLTIKIPGEQRHIVERTKRMAPFRDMTWGQFVTELCKRVYDPEAVMFEALREIRDAINNNPKLYIAERDILLLKVRDIADTYTFLRRYHNHEIIEPHTIFSELNNAISDDDLRATIIQNIHRMREQVRDKYAVEL